LAGETILVDVFASDDDNSFRDVMISCWDDVGSGGIEF
jgi:hypothetical protein